MIENSKIRVKQLRLNKQQQSIYPSFNSTLQVNKHCAPRLREPIKKLKTGKFYKHQYKKKKNLNFFSVYFSTTTKKMNLMI